jgi:hypothetical protein
MSDKERDEWMEQIVLAKKKRVEMGSKSTTPGDFLTTK